MRAAGNYVAVIGIQALLLVLAGCGGSSAPSAGQGGGSGAATGSASTAPDKSESIKANLAKLSDDDRAAAEKQRTCVVTNQPLGSMGPPVKVAVEGRDVWICCSHCEDALKADPDKYLAKLSP